MTVLCIFRQPIVISLICPLLLRGLSIEVHIFAWLDRCDICYAIIDTFVHFDMRGLATVSTSFCALMVAGANICAFVVAVRFSV